MRLAELSERSGLSTTTIKYYLREGLLPPGRRITATQAEYDEGHLRRLRLVRALIQIGRVPVTTAREVLAAVEDESLDQHTRVGAAVWALPHGPQETREDERDDEREDPAAVAARGEVERLVDELGWPFTRAVGELSPSYRMLVSAVAAMNRFGYPVTRGHLLPYARLAARQAVHDLDLIEAYGTPLGQVEAAVALTVLSEPVLLALRRMAAAEESNRRFGDEEPDEHEEHQEKQENQEHGRR